MAKWRGCWTATRRDSEPALAAHQATLEGRVRQFADAVEKVRRLRADLARGEAPAAGELTRLLGPAPEFSVAFDLPWPWGGERFELRDIRALNYIIGPLGSGKTRLAKRIAEALPDAAFLGLERLADAGAAARARLDADPALKSRVDQTLAWLVEDGGLVPRRPWSPCSPDWNWKARPSWSSTCWNRVSTRPPKKP